MVHGMIHRLATERNSTESITATRPVAKDARTGYNAALPIDLYGESTRVLGDDRYRLFRLRTLRASKLSQYMDCCMECQVRGTNIPLGIW